MNNLNAIFNQRKLNAKAETIELPKAFTDKFPDLSTKKAEKFFNDYLETVLSELMARLPFLSDGETHVSTEKLFHDCGEFRYKKQRFWVWKEFKDIYPLMIVLDKGSNLKGATNHFEKNSRVKIVNERLLNILLRGRDPEVVFNHYYADVDFNNPEIEPVPIDMANLENYIGSTEYELTKAPTGNLKAKLQKNLWQALIVHKIGQHTRQEADVAFLPMIPSPSVFGRVYYKGINIQNVTKEVRSAIIGHHYQYDMNAASFAIKLFMYGEINGGDNNIINTTKGSYTREYLRNKNQIRNRLARECYEGLNLKHDLAVKNIKNALTAIGFGAKTNGKMWMTEDGLKGTALSEILVSPEARTRFLEDNWVKRFLTEQDEIEDTILESIEEDDDYQHICQVVRSSNGVNGRVTKAGKLAYLYQHWETHIMNVVVEVLQQYGIKVIARIHDAFIVKDRIPERVMDEVRVALANRDYMTFDCDEVREWVSPDYRRALDEVRMNEEQHRNHMAGEEQKARLHVLAGGMG